MKKHEENRQVAVSERDLILALDHLDNIAPDVQREDWYKNLSRALDLHLKPRAMAHAKNKATRH